MQEGRVKIGTGEWPAYLYDENQVYDPEEKDKGLLRGYLLVRVRSYFSLFLISDLLQVYRHIFTGPATAFIGSGRKGTKASKSKLHGLSSVTPRTIAYAAVQVSSNIIHRQRPQLPSFTDTFLSLLAQPLVQA